MEHGSIGEERRRSRGERGRKQQERERTWELLNGRTGEAKNQAGNWQKETEPEKIREGMGDKRGRSMEKMKRNQQELGRARKEPGRDGEGPEK